MSNSEVILLRLSVSRNFEDTTERKFERKPQTRVRSKYRLKPRLSQTNQTEFGRICMEQMYACKLTCKPLGLNFAECRDWSLQLRANTNMELQQLRLVSNNEVTCRKPNLLRIAYGSMEDVYHANSLNGKASVESAKV